MTDNFDKLFKRFAKLGPRQFEEWAIIGSCSIGHYKRVKKIKSDKSKKPAKWRGRDSPPPRSLAAQRFSRPPRSTTLPSLLKNYS